MKRWVSVTSHLFAATTSFVTLSVVPVVAYGALALLHSWQAQSDVVGDASSILTVPLLSALSAAVFSVTVAPTLAVFGQRVSQRFNWHRGMFPVLAGCAATVGFSAANALLGLGWTPLAVIGGGLATATALSAYWLPLNWAQKALPHLDDKCGQLRSRLGSIKKPLPISLS